MDQADNSATDCVNGGEFTIHGGLKGQNGDRKASSWLPIFDGDTMEKLLDGGIVDPIPVRKSIADGNDKNIIVLTSRDKKPLKCDTACKIKYRRFPKLIEMLKNRHEVYNQTLAFVDQLEAEERRICHCNL